MGDSLNATAYKTKKIKCLKPENATQFPRNPKQAYQWMSNKQDYKKLE